MHKIITRVPIPARVFSSIIPPLVLTKISKKDPFRPHIINILLLSKLYAKSHPNNQQHRLKPQYQENDRLKEILGRELIDVNCQHGKQELSLNPIKKAEF
jgi:hypothetical protein